MRTFVRLSSLLLVVSPSIVAADGRVDASFALGGHLFAEDGALGADATMDDPGPIDSGVIGGRVGVRLTKRLAAEAELMVIPTEDDVLGDYATVFGTRAHARFDLMTGKLRPFLVAGVGALVLRANTPQLDNDTQAELHWGGGVRYAINDRFDLRVDVRHLIVADRTDDGLTSDLEATMGVGIRFGGKAKPVRRPVVAEVPVIGDSDRDGLLDNVDKCPAKAEDKDSFEDSDGCPDLDNDKDKIADTGDACPLQAETINGWQDGDGCPDEMIAEIAGIQFEIHSARIDSGSTSVLVKAYQLLAENPNLRVEISGHTSAEGDADKNEQLSRWRAAAVKKWLVKKGIVEGRIEVVGHGAGKPVASNDTEAGRMQNRRIEFRVLLPTARNEK